MKKNKNDLTKLENLVHSWMESRVALTNGTGALESLSKAENDLCVYALHNLNPNNVWGDVKL